MGIYREKNSNRLEMFSKPVISNISKYMWLHMVFIWALQPKPIFLVGVLREDYIMQIACIREEKGCLVICAQILNAERCAVSKG